MDKVITRQFETKLNADTVVFIELNDDKIRTRSSRIEVVDKLFINSFLSHLCIVQH